MKRSDAVSEAMPKALGDRSHCKSLEVWKFNRQVGKVKKGHTLRIQAVAPFRLHWSKDNWQTTEDTPSTSTALGIEYVDIPVSGDQQTTIQFTFFWTASSDWEQRNYKVAVE